MNETAKLDDGPAPGGAQDPRTAGLVAFSQNRKQDSRERLLAAAVTALSETGYTAASVEDIAAEAGLSRVTFYRHFGSKADLVVALYEQARETSRSRFFGIQDQDFRDPAVVRDWIATIFASARANRRMLYVFKQAAAAEPAFTAHAHDLMAASIAALGDAIPAFAVDPEAPGQRRRWLEAWLLLYEILDQSNHAAIDSGVAMDPLVIDILTDRFMRFLESAT